MGEIDQTEDGQCDGHGLFRSQVEFLRHLVVPPFRAHFARVVGPSTDDGKTVTHPFFLPNEAHHGDPRS